LSPLEITCSECGRVSPSFTLFDREALGPRWSVEHASRRFIRKWLATTLMTLRPSVLWREFRPEHAVFRSRLAWMAVSWLLMLHLACGVMVGGSWLWMSAYGAGATPSWMSWEWDQWPFWDRLLNGLAWPYNRWIELPMSANTTVGNPSHEFVAMTASPVLMMGALMTLWLSWRARRGSGHLRRALVLMLPTMTMWMILFVLAFAAVGLLGPPSNQNGLGTVLMISLVLGFAANIAWWWRCYVVHFAGRSRRTWVPAPLSILALVVGWLIAASIDQYFAGR